MLKTGDVVVLRDSASRVRGVVSGKKFDNGLGLWSLPKTSRWIQWEDKPEGELEWSLEKEVKVVKRFKEEVKPKKNRGWSYAERRYLCKMYNTQTYPYIAKKLHKTKNQVQYYAEKFGLIKHNSCRRSKVEAI
jgi:hypothetical protein